MLLITPMHGAAAARVREDEPARAAFEEAGVRHGGAPEGMIVVDSSWRPVASDPGGQAILTELNERQATDNLLFHLPPEVRDSIRATPLPELTATIARVNTAVSQYSCRVFVMMPQNGAVGPPLLAIHFKRERSLGEAIRRVGRAYRLTAREQEAVIGISMGLTSKQVADRMNISPNTVNAFLRLIMVKMGVTTRAGIVGKLLNGKSDH